MEQKTLTRVLCFLLVRRRRLSRAQQPQIILLKEGTDTSQGKAQLISNINACQAVMEAVRTTLGPRGMDKLIHAGNKVREESKLRLMEAVGSKGEQEQGRGEKNSQC